MPGPPEVLTLREVPLPDVRPGWVVVQVRAFGLNRSEMFTRQGHSPGVRFPRVLGIECVGVVADPSDSGLAAGTTVAAVMGGMGRDYDGGYAEYALLPADRLMTLTTTLDWPTLGALPETFLTAAGSLDVMAAVAGQRLLIREPHPLSAWPRCPSPPPEACRSQPPHEPSPRPRRCAGEAQTG